MLASTRGEIAQTFELIQGLFNAERGMLQNPFFMKRQRKTDVTSSVALLGIFVVNPNSELFGTPYFFTILSC